MDLLKIGWVRRLFLSRWFPLAPQVILLLVFVLIIAGGLGITTGDAKFAKILRNTNLANLLVWSYWWPLIIVVSILVGRIWCMVCPIELVTAAASKIGLKRQVPHFFKSGWVITIFFTVILLVGIHTLSIHRLPHRMAIYMLVLFGVAMACSLLFEKRAFCSYVCPVGHLLGLYALISPWQWRVSDKTKCENCKTKDCIAKRNQYRLVGRSCTSDLYPAAITDNRDCLLCTQCLKVCPNKNLGFSLRKPFADFFQALQLKSAQVGFILLVSGFVVYEILSEWSKSKTVLKWAPDHFNKAIGITGEAAGFVSAVVLFLAFPAILFSVVALLSRLLSSVSARTAARTFALLLLPTMAAAHLIKAMLKMTSRIPYWSGVFSDPKGEATAQQIMDKTLILDKSVPDALGPVISCLAAGILLAALAASLLILHKSVGIKKLNLRVKIVLLMGVLGYWTVFGVTIYLWRF